MVTTEKWHRLYVGCRNCREAIWAIAILDCSGKFWRWWHVKFMQVLEGVVKSMDCSPKGELGVAGSLRSWWYGRCGSLTSRSRWVLLALRRRCNRGWQQRQCRRIWSPANSGVFSPEGEVKEFLLSTEKVLVDLEPGFVVERSSVV